MTKLDLIEYIEKYIEEKLDTIEINTGQGRIDWKEDATTVFHLNHQLQRVINTLQYVNLKDIK